jgi:hypothetical protein
VVADLSKVKARKNAALLKDDESLNSGDGDIANE